MPMDWSQFAAVLLDMDGVLYHGEQALPGAGDLVRTLQQRGLPMACISNGTSSPNRLCKRLAGMDISMPPELIYTAGVAAADYVIERFGPKPAVYNLATRGVNEVLDGKVRWVERPDEACDAVIVGTPQNTFASEPRQRTAIALARRGAVVLGTSADRIYPSPRGIEIGSGAFTWMIAYAASVPPVFVGKPQPEFFAHVCARLKVAARDCLLIGDNLDADIAGAAALSMKSVLVLTGVSTAQEAAAAAPDRRPDWTIQSLSELIG